MQKVFVTRREIMTALGVSEWLFRKLRRGGTIKPVVMKGYARGKYYRTEEVKRVLGVEGDLKS